MARKKASPAGTKPDTATKEGTKYVGVRFERHHLDAIEHAAEAKGCSVGDLIRRAAVERAATILNTSTDRGFAYFSSQAQKLLRFVTMGIPRLYHSKPYEGDYELAVKPGGSLHVDATHDPMSVEVKNDSPYTDDAIHIDLWDGAVEEHYFVVAPQLREDDVAELCKLLRQGGDEFVTILQQVYALIKREQQAETAAPPLIDPGKLFSGALAEPPQAERSGDTANGGEK